ncbi:uncharacterized protein LOC111034700 [Myzus persicae]|uniref:uncharacterized protein LOC111034700 n=1 Tax=Myzus persicae TaxID=13164 RepID=UPI000B9341BD|nr:uncharacterized protein LOC111034700 [Myzus persicae]
MVDSKISRENEYNWDLFSTKDILLVISMVLMVFTFTLHANSLETDSINEIDCPDFNTCMTCTNKSLCSWSVELQVCINTNLLQKPHGNLTVHNEMHCPRFTVVNKSSVAGVSFKYTVKISNDVNGAVTSFLNSSTITCCIESCDFRGLVVDDSITCAAIRTPWSYFANGARALISYIYIMVGDKKLQFNNDADHYYTIYDRDCAASTAAAADHCATCLWSDRGFKHYLKWCPTSNPCTGSYQIYDKRDADGDKKFLFADNDDDVVRIRCAEISIVSVRPLNVPRNGGGTTTMTITVRNHRMLAENRTVTVAVAGRLCDDPATYDDQTITCSLLQPSVTTAVASAGPAEVVYSSASSSTRPSQNTRFALRSSEVIGFVDPETTSVRPICGSISGGITLTVRGRFLDIGNAVRVSIVSNVNETEVGETVLMTCDTVSRDRHTIVCRTAVATPHSNYNSSSPSSARVKVQFDGGPIKYVQSPASWTLCKNGDAALEAGQTFSGIVSGGTSVPVHGVRFSCLADAHFYVHDRDGTKYQHTTGCRVVNDTFMECRSPDMRRSLSAVDVATTAVFPDFGVQAWGCDEGRPLDMPVRHPQQQRLSATAVRSPFSVYADPVYVDFEIRDGAVVISRGHPSSSAQGYAAGDVAVQFRNSTGGCNVTSLSRHEIVCQPTSTTTATVLGRLQRIVVTVGGDGGYVCDVQKKLIHRDAWSSGGRGGRSLLFASITFSCCSGVAIVSAAMLLFAVGVALYRIITKNRYVISADT